MTRVAQRTRCLMCGRDCAVRLDGKIHAHACRPRQPKGPTENWARVAERRSAIIDAYTAAPADAKPTLAALGRAHGITRERVRQYLAEIGIHPRIVNRAAKAEADRERLCAAFWAALCAALERPPCVICGAWVIRTYRDVKTCSTECSERYCRSARFVIDKTQHEAHRLQRARSILRNRDTNKPSMVAWAERMMGPNPPPPNRRYATVNKDLFDKTSGESTLDVVGPNLLRDEN